MYIKRLQFNYLVDRVAARVGGWMSNDYSVGGKEVLIKSVLQSIPTYAMTCFRIPVAVCNDIERVCARFWWGDKEKERHMHWLKWSDMCKPKSRGGMGFRDMVDFNQALVAKQVWRLIRFPDTLLAKMMKAKYYPDSEVMEAGVPSNCSYSWRSLIWGRELLNKGLMWRVGKGRNVRVFKDAWLPTLYDGRLIRRHTGRDGVMASDFMNEEGKWDKEKLDELMLPVEVAEIMKIERDNYAQCDVRYWRFEQNGEYTAKSGYLVASGYHDINGKTTDISMQRWWKYVWSFDLPPRIRIFAWRVFRNIIPSELNLHRHHIPLFGKCGWCNKDWGSTAHVLLYCEKTRKFWYEFAFWDLLKKWEGFQIEEIGGAMQFNASREAFQQWLVGMWLIWKALCGEKHENKTAPWDSLQQESISYIENHDEARKQAALASRVLPNEGGRTWNRPKKGRYRLDVDYALATATGQGGIGAILRNNKGAIVFALAKPIAQAMTVLHGELQALVFGIKQCVEEDISPVEVFSDSILAIMAVEEEKEDGSILYEDFFDFFATVKKINVLSISHVRREANMATHELAQFASSSVSTSLWHDKWPLWLSSIVSDDVSK